MVKFVSPNEREKSFLFVCVSISHFSRVFFEGKESYLNEIFSGKFGKEAMQKVQTFQGEGKLLR